MKIVITGGHVTPALAIIEALPKGTDLTFIGRKHTFESDSAISFEYEEITRRGLPFRTLPSARLQRSVSKHTIPSLLRVPKSVHAARKLLQEVKPDVVLSFGGYVGLPAIIAAATLAIPSVIHEQTTRAGFANKLSARFATKICISWESSRQYFPVKKTVFTGNPLRKEVLSISAEQEALTGLPKIYITGGSGGSHFLNVLVEKHLEKLLSIAEVTHQTGNAKEFKDFDRLLHVRNSLPDALKNRYHPKQFLFSQEVSEALAHSDLVIGRSGINTVSELLYFETPTLSIPLPTGQRGEQLENATLLATLGLGRVLLQSSSERQFLSQVREMISLLPTFELKDPSLREHFIHAAEKIVTVLSDVANKTTNKKA